MDLKEVFEKLEKLENGAEMITAIKAETNRLNNEAKSHRQNGDKAAAKDMAKLIADRLVVGDDESLMYKNGDTDVSVEDGVKAWLTENTWAVKANVQGGSGALGGGAGGNEDPFCCWFYSSSEYKLILNC